MAVLSIILTAPSGAILINTLGTRWLSDDTPKVDEENTVDEKPKVEELREDQGETTRQLYNGENKASVF